MDTVDILIYNTNIAILLSEPSDTAKNGEKQDRPIPGTIAIALLRSTNG